MADVLQESRRPPLGVEQTEKGYLFTCGLGSMRGGDW